MKWLWLFCVGLLYAEPCVVFIHIGPQLPAYLGVAVAQARLFNPEIPIYVLANEAALKGAPEELKTACAVCVSCEAVPKGSLHERFLKQTKLVKGFWTVTTERFFYLADLMQMYKLGDVVHLESDVMLYADVSALLPVLKEHYAKTVGVTFDNDDRGIAGFVYIPYLLPLNHFLEMIVESAKEGGNDMVFLGQFKHRYLKQFVDSLPIVVPEYAAEHPLVSTSGCKGSSPEEFTHCAEKFNSIFDAAALGQYLGGEYHQSQPGFINERCVFNPALFQFVWEKDSEERLVPFAIYREKRWKINNLHIHCKNLKEFKSK